MALQPGDVANFETLKRAFANGDVCLMECTDAATGEYRAVICAVYTDEGAGENGEDMIATVPLATMPYGDPYELWKPPE